MSGEAVPPEDPGPEDVSVEATGETVGEAKWKALRDLERSLPDLDREGVRFQVVSEGERGLLGVGYVPARVIASASRAVSHGREERSAPAPESDLASHVRALVERVVGAMGIGTRVDVLETPDELVATCSGGDLGLLIGKHGQTIDALQYVANAAVYRLAAGKPVTIDAAGYRERRRATLEAIALRGAERALRGERVTLEPMTSVERKLVHERLKDLAGVETASEGAEPSRSVVVFPV